MLADITHEMGHAQGLDHNSDYNSSIMYPSIDWAPTFHENPLCGDQARMQMIYGS
jgi:predicted Zn-dependent protease